MSLIPYIKKYWISALIPPLMVVVAVISDLAQPTLMAQIVDKGIAAENLTFVVEAGIKMVAISLMGMVAGLIMSWHASKVSINVGADLREDLFKKVQTLSYGNLDRLESSSLITRLTSDVKQIERIINISLRILIRAPLKIIGSLTMAIIISRGLSLVLLIFAPLIAITIITLMRRAQPLFHGVQQKLDQLNSRLQENLAGIRVIKAFAREDREREKFAKASDQLREKNIQANRLMATMHPLMNLFMNAAVVIVLWWGSDLVLAGEFPVGKLLAFINYLSQMLFMLVLVSNVIIQLTRSQVSLKRIGEVFEQTPQVEDSPELDEGLSTPIIEGDLTFENVSFSYGEDSEPVLTDINFSIARGKTLAILGATGSGKSSLVNLIPRFYDPQKGSIKLGGVDIKKIPQSSLRQKIGLVPQTPLLFSGPVEKNIRFGGNFTDKEVIEAAAIAQIDSFISTLPEKYSTDVNQRGVNFSGGQKQRLSLARALIRQPSILILDDSTSAVDLKTEAAIQKALKKQEPRATRIIVAQRISSVRHADLIVLLEKGKIAAKGTHEELIETSPLYQEICLSQSESKESA